MSHTRKNATVLFTLSAVTAIGFLVFLIGVATNARFIARFDTYWIDIVRVNISTTKTDVIAFITNFGGVGAIVMMTIVLLLIFIFLKRYTIAIWFGGTVLIGGALLPWVIKQIIARPRPTDMLVSQGGYSFPSGHATGSTAFYGMIAALLIIALSKMWHRIVIGIVAFLIILTIMYTRVYLGVHYPSDVTAGLLLGSTAVLAGSALFLLYSQSCHRYLLSRNWKDVYLKKLE
ncbi:phosphatase PAP2 family protein [Listeria booriae]|uniref:Phosphatase PAP2 family protein n=1 Tax=Listeria booriae TaxID=1552123 RepID=A0A7X0ZR87_9LIST|nr:phosphatase PAP2 family protein [Listeria booriae]MBC1562341.1 phosphatase PAP2 family protein [Listeria booriae]MBC1649426.1 phosphatase PAP2 family protein [Listeria booriae]MBC1887907.1 phosphatase PAP2 family protein [Listeria booriae]MBC2239739.1 phosphatase PAP2 family protein [Listeria booriae]MBC2285951.1 phosphatase PAP2 family protein [Listeria booriae]